ncbi:nicotinamidase [Corynebacterium uberis]|uniref:nicotinamidase n=1 Tax=Corynebacterium TaxID=1716 RepID=UPI001D09F562|nr:MULTISPECIES: nicotinamidase [Corynebacterium]MCZ9310231.1 nicotinamidase [Corynebacterium sp. c6VSa_13]UDL73706.1 nicotinamidase [Corynebacterium uberis]UDL75412.1 nicotinamidase [Corynebacterium uberis]UDL77625.1 nicotinamidase [Corynebacterium uberis]UDL79910.1 nicotinamidase [Corynebacterium uberis]
MTSLIVVDVQNDFCPGGALATADGDRVAAGLAQLLAGPHPYRHLIATQDWHIDPGSHFSEQPDFVDSWPVHCRADSAGAQFHPALADAAFDAVFRKGQYTAAYSGFEGTEATGLSLERWLRDQDVTRIDVAGIATDFCVRATVLDALSAGFEVRVLTDLVSAVAPDSGARALEEMQAAGAQLV